MREDFKTTAIKEVLTSFGSKLIQKARANLNKKKGRANGTLFNQMSYDIVETENSLKFEMNFGQAKDYWAFVDQGVRGKGGYKGRGNLRGVGSPFRFGTRSGKENGLRLAIERWVLKKGIRGRIKSDWKDKKGAGRFITKKSLVFLISRAIYLRGLERSRFISKPFEDMIDDLKVSIAMAGKVDIEQTEQVYLQKQKFNLKISL